MQVGEDPDALSQAEGVRSNGDKRSPSRAFASNLKKSEAVKTALVLQVSVKKSETGKGPVMKNINVRQRTYYSNRDIKKSDYRYVDIFQYSLFEDEPVRILKTRTGKEKFTAPAKKVMTDKKSRLYFDLLLKGNFGENDYFVSLTYSDKFLPETEEGAEAQIKKYIKDLRKEAKRRGVNNLKYIYVTESGKTRGRVHHHLILQNCLPRDVVEGLWSKQIRPFHPEREMIGWCNAKRIQVTGPDFMIRISKYLSKDPAGRKRWKQSTGLILPGTTKADNVCSVKQFEQMSLFGNTIELEKYVKKHHRGFVILEAEKELNEFTGQWYVRLQLMRKTLWQKTMAICEAREKEKLDKAAEMKIPYVPEFKINGIQGVLW